MNSIKSNIRELSLSISPSGFEMEVMQIWKSMITPYVNEVYLCPLGDLVAHKQGKGDKSIMLVAHADEIGIIITNIDKAAKIAFFDEIGGIDTKLFLGRTVTVTNATGQFTGVIGSQPIHRQNRLQTQDPQRLEPKDLFIDFGASIDFINIGDSGVISPLFIENGNHISGKAMDDRIGLAIMVEVAKLLKDIPLMGNIYFVASTMEEIGARGVRTVANRIKPAQCIVIDTSIATDTPLSKQDNYSPIVLGKGAVITVGPNLDKNITDKLKGTASSYDIPFQIEVCAHPTGSDANPVQITQRGIPCGLLGIPCRYIHTPVETVDMDDIKSSVLLLTKYIINQFN